jgi:hypothetical protein
MSKGPRTATVAESMKVRIVVSALERQAGIW